MNLCLNETYLIVCVGMSSQFLLASGNAEMFNAICLLAKQGKSWIRIGFRCTTMESRLVR